MGLDMMLVLHGDKISICISGSKEIQCVLTPAKERYRQCVFGEGAGCAVTGPFWRGRGAGHEHPSSLGVWLASHFLL